MADNIIYLHPEGGTYGLLMEGVPIKDDKTGDWLDGVLYVSAQDHQIRSTTVARWKDRFVQTVYEGDDPAVLAMLQRIRPGDSGFDFIRVFESWGEAEANLTGVLLDLAIAATMVKLGSDGGELTVTAADLRNIAENYDIHREETPAGWTIKLNRR